MARATRIQKHGSSPISDTFRHSSYQGGAEIFPQGRSCITRARRAVDDESGIRLVSGREGAESSVYPSQLRDTVEGRWTVCGQNRSGHETNHRTDSSDVDGLA